MLTCTSSSFMTVYFFTSGTNESTVFVFKSYSILGWQLRQAEPPLDGKVLMKWSTEFPMEAIYANRFLNANYQLTGLNEGGSFSSFQLYQFQSSQSSQSSSPSSSSSSSQSSFQSSSPSSSSSQSYYYQSSFYSSSSSSQFYIYSYSSDISLKFRKITIIERKIKNDNVAKKRAQSQFYIQYRNKKLIICYKVIYFLYIFLDIIYYQMTQHIALGLLHQNQNHAEVSPSKQMRKLKIQLADRAFQLKKMQQDFAEEKAHLLMQFNQQKSNLNSTIRQLKTKLSDQNDHWVNKINQIRLSGEELIEKNNKYWKTQIQNEVGLKVQSIKSKYEAQIVELKKNIAKLNQSVKQKEKNFEKKLSCLRENYKAQICELKQLKETQIEQVKKKMSRDQEIKINALMHTKNGQQKEHQNTKNLLLKRQRQYNEIMKKYQERVFELNQQVWSLKNKVENLSKKYNQQNQQITKLEQVKVSIVQVNSKQYEQRLQKSEEEWRKNLESLNQKWKNEYKKLQMAYQKVSNVCAQKEKLWQDRGNKVLKLYEMREAREEDVKLIEHLQVQLIKKEFQLERQKQELKCCKLELDNMDDIYKRIFNSVKKNRQSHSFQLKKMKLPGIMNKSTHPVKGQFYL